MTNDKSIYYGKIVFDPVEVTKKHEIQSVWKKTAMVLLNGEIAEYYSWFLLKRFNLKLNKPIRGAHVTFINDKFDDIRGETEVDKLMAWQQLKSKWDGKEIAVVLNLNPRSDKVHWWLNVDREFRDELHSIRAEIGLGRPFFGLHMTIGYANEYNQSHSEYILNCSVQFEQ